MVMFMGTMKTAISLDPNLEINLVSSETHNGSMACIQGIRKTLRNNFLVLFSNEMAQFLLNVDFAHILSIGSILFHRRLTSFLEAIKVSYYHLEQGAEGMLHIRVMEGSRMGNIIYLNNF